MKSYSLDDVRNCLSDFDISSGDLVMVHSSLLGLGRIRDHKMSDAPRAIANCLLEHLGPQGTLVVPAFNFGFCRGEAFDRQQTPSDKMGLLSEVVRALPGAVRSRHPMQSIAACGPLAQEICDLDTPSAFDKGGSFDRLLQRNATLLLLGASFQAASVIHYAEQHVGVPYRYWKDFSAPYIDEGKPETKTYRMYVRDLDLDPQLIMTAIETELTARQQLQRKPLGAGTARSCSFQHLIDATSDRLVRDPNCLIAEDAS